MEREDLRKQIIALGKAYGRLCRKVDGRFNLPTLAVNHLNPIMSLARLENIYLNKTGEIDRATLNYVGWAMALFPDFEETYTCDNEMYDVFLLSMTQEQGRSVKAKVKNLEGITQDDLAERLGVSRVTLNRWLNGVESDIPKQKLVKLEMVLDNIIDGVEMD